MQMQDDFILRIIEMISDFIASLISGKKWEIKDFESMAGEKIGLSYNAIIKMDAPTLLGILSTNLDTYAIKVYLASALLIHEAQKQEEMHEAVLYYHKALFLLKNLEPMNDLSYMDDIKNLIEFVQSKLKSLSE